MTSLIKEWAASAERRITHQLAGKALKQYYDGERVVAMSAVIRYNQNRNINERPGHIAIHRAFRPPEEFSPDLPRGGAHACRKPFQACLRSAARLSYTPISAAGAMSITLTRAAD